MTQADFFRPGGPPPRMLEILDGMHADSPDRWIPRRLILQNYWLFEEPEVFHFARGNLMLTGQNESGKSTVLVTAITLVLDMVLTPDRVDTMGSSDRSIRYYLVGKDDAPDDAPYYHRERTAYIALEFERGHSGRFATIGLGLRCSRDWANQKVDRWGFVLEDSRRVEIDFHLADGGRPLRETELRDRLGKGGRIYRDQQEYKTAVNRAIFGFPTTGDYERFLEMLHVVRTPKLGEGLNPRKVEGYLKESLPPIPTAAVEGASDVFSKLDTIEAELERLSDQLAAARDLEPAQENAVLASARQAAAVYQQAAKEHKGRQKALDRLLSDLESAQKEVDRQNGIREALASERSAKQGRLDVLLPIFRAHEAFDLEAALKRAREEHAEAESAHGALRQDRKRINAEIEREQKTITDAETAWRTRRGRLGETLDGIATAAGRAFWPSLERRAAGARDGIEGMGIEGTGAIVTDIARSALEPDVAQRRAVLAEIVGAMEALATANRRHEEARKASEVARREYNKADDQYRTAVRDADTARTKAGDALLAWRSACTELPVTADAFEAALGALDLYEPQGGRPTRVLEPLQSAFDDAQQALRAQRQELGFLQRSLRDESAEVEARLRKAMSEEDVEPDRAPAQVEARRLLREQGIAHAPLFAACDLAGPLAADPALAARVEAALLEAGLLDALVIPAAEADRVREILDGSGVGDRWIRPAVDRHMAGRGSRVWLVPVASGGISTADVRMALRALGLDGGGAGAVDEGGGWRLGALEGLAAAPAGARVRFLGETARREERRRRIDEARALRDQLRERLETVGGEIEIVEARERTLAREWRSAQEMPALQAVHDRLLAVRREETERDRRRAAADMTAESVEAATRDVQQRTAALDHATDAAPYLKGRARADVDAVGSALKEVLDLARAVADHVERMEEIRRAYADRTRAAADLRLAIEALAPRIARADERAHTLEASIRALEERLRHADAGREGLATEIRALEDRLKQVDRVDQDAVGAIREAGGRIAILNNQRTDYEEQVRSTRISAEAAEFTLRRRIGAYPTLDEYGETAREGGAEKAAYRLLEHGDAAAVDAEAERAQEELRAAFLRAQGAFEEMSPTLDGDLVRFAHPDREMRLDELYRALEEEQGRKETLLEDEDRRLIEQLMLREVVDAIRSAIRQTGRWVDEVNRILGGMQLYRGAVMRLQWKVRTRETADAFDPARLDDLLTQKVTALDEARREELLEIFRTMVADIRRRNREKELLEDYRAALLRMVDYTQWYTLTVERKDETGRWMPLTRRLYGQGSGGRRTLDLLLPLVAAVSARLESADPYAPRLIGFDEAFAGVDDRNAAEIYGLLSELGFCWIMATEKTTGIGASVAGSATYELLTDGATVAPTLSLWDGERRFEFVGDELLGIQIAPRTAGSGADGG